ncbi:MAG: GIY-YIG nuclease family protein [Desulfurococcales archaeon]|jgi:Uri superfamily endonuclease|nr:GIY-YIG nuclease family protein [Desulfurococcales archaeon]
MLLLNRARVCIEIGGLGIKCIDPGLYGYIGSARGYGGLRARVSRHIRRDKERWWHIDYITSLESCEIVFTLYIETSKDLEKELADILTFSQCWTGYIKGFGSSDKRSYTHLFRCVCEAERCLSEAIMLMNIQGYYPNICDSPSAKRRPRRSRSPFSLSIS